MPGLSKANAQRPTQPFWDVLAEMMAAAETLARAVRIGREQPLGAATPKQRREMGQLLERTESCCDATTLALPPRLPGGRARARTLQCSVDVSGSGHAD